MTSVVSKWGNSSAVRLPRKLLEQAGISEGMSVEISARDNVITLKPSRKPIPRKTIQERFAEFPAEFIREEELDWGEPVGDEIW